MDERARVRAGVSVGKVIHISTGWMTWRIRSGGLSSGTRSLMMTIFCLCFRLTAGPLLLWDVTSSSMGI